MIYFVTSQDPYSALTQLLLQDQKWNCKFLFNEADPTSKEPTLVDLLDSVKHGDPYIFPSRFNGIEKQKEVIVELKIAAIQAGFNLTPRSSKTHQRLSRENSNYCSYIQMNCTNDCLYDKKRREQRLIKGVYKTRTRYQTDKNKLCPFKFNIGCRKSDGKRELRPPITSKRP